MSCRLIIKKRLQRKVKLSNLAADFVSTGDGTGVVHAAPAFGEDDYNTLCRAQGIMVCPCPIDDNGCFTAEALDYAGQYIKDATGDCERSESAWFGARSPLLRAQLSNVSTVRYAVDISCYSFWYVRVEALKSRLLAANQQINCA